MNSKHIYIFDSCLEDYSGECFIFVASALKLSNRKKIQPVCLTKIVSENINNFTYFLKPPESTAPQTCAYPTLQHKLYPS